MLTDLHQKSGTLCQAARQGQLRCPLIVRSTSEDVITGHLVQTLRMLNPTWWLPDLLNLGLGAARFRRQYFRGFRIEPWVNKARYPRELLPWDEGSTQVDFCITWENPATTIYVEMKYGSDLSDRTTGNSGREKYPADQLVRNIRVGLLECGHISQPDLFSQPRRDFAVVVVSPRTRHPLVSKYRREGPLLRSIPHAEHITSLPARPFVGELGYKDIIQVLRQQRQRFTRPEQAAVDQLIDYLEHKQAHAPEYLKPWQRGFARPRTVGLPVIDVSNLERRQPGERR